MTSSLVSVAWLLVVVTALIKVQDGFAAPEFNEWEERGSDQIPTGEKLLEKLKGPSEAAQLSPEKAKHRIRLLLKRIDTSGDEIITQAEMIAWILQSLRMLSREKVQQRLSTVDTDQDGRVSWQEHLVDIKASTKLRKQQDKEMFKLADVDDDALLTVEEYHGFCYPGEDPRLLPLLRTHVMTRLDQDEDNRLSFREYLVHSMLSDQSDYSRQLVERERFDALYDEDEDGFLSGREVEDMLDKDHRGVARKAVKYLLQEMDEDLDEALSFSEVFRHRDVLQTSVASDFGKHLTKTHRLKEEL